MPNTNGIDALGRWQGYLVGTTERLAAEKERKREEIWIELRPDPDAPLLCDQCGEPAEKVIDAFERWIRDLPAWGADTYLLLPRQRVLCKTCGVTVQRLDWLERYARVTARLAESVARLCEVLPIKHVAEFYGLSWDVTKRIHKAYLERTLGPPDLSDIDVIIMDEFALRKGQTYATVIVEPSLKKVLWIAQGRDRKGIRPFFEALGQEGRDRLKAIGMDMHKPFEEEVKAQCPNAQIVYDLFHVVAKYGREVIDRVRVDEANRLRHDKAARKVVKGSKWLLLRNGNNLDRDDRVRLHELLAANRTLLKVYVLKDDLKHLWDYVYRGAAERFWHDWYNRAIRSRIEPLKKFARALKKRIEGVLAHCKFPIHTSLIEGINNKIKVIKRMAYGFRDDDYFFLRIRAAFPGIRG